MIKRVSWRKGMRLTEELLKASDNCHYEWISCMIALASAGRFGLFPQSRPFDVSLNIVNGIVDVEAINCLAITKGGHLIDLQYDTRYSNSFDTRVKLPDDNTGNEYLLLINALSEHWNEANDGYEMPAYDYSVVAPNTPIPSNSLPIARIINELGWHQDDINFVPPCLFVSSHPKFMELRQQYYEVLSTINNNAISLIYSKGKETIRLFWPIVQQQMIAIDKECDLMTPMMLLSNVQKLVSAFTCACELDDNLELSDADTFRSYISVSYNYKDVYQKIKDGLDLCFSINTKLGMIGVEQPQKLLAPSVLSENLTQECVTKDVSIPIIFSSTTAKLYFTIDGSNPTENSLRVQSTRNGFRAVFENGFNKIGKEPDKNIPLKIVAIEDGMTSPVATYEVTLIKSLKFRNARPI